ncbi:MAG TPA: dTDP-4-dehydrorhamnose reductase [Tepidisphaeraceae bacterium]|nr:dTDP-4-dehydrorhamnose reductase [Tepidisphaeraceae bacterium]
MTPADPILITGGGGMLALAFKRLLPKAHFVDKTGLDIAEEHAVRKVFAELRPKLLVNCAAYTKVDLAEQNVELANQINGHAAGILARVCKEHDTMLVHYSTDYVFDGTLRRPLKPDDPVGPQSAYGRSKLLGEQLLWQNPPLRWLLIRTAWLYGPGGPCFPQAILNAARAGKPLNVVDDQLGCPTFTFDLARATIELIEHDAPSGIWHVVNDGEVTWHDFAAAILEEFKVPANLGRTTSTEWKKTRPNSAIRPAYSVLDIVPFEKLTRHRTPHWREALKNYARQA